MKKYLFFLILFSSLLIKSQKFSWAKMGIGSDADEGVAVSTDASSNVYITGGFKSPTICFGTYTLTNTGGNSDVFLTKYDSNGNVIWAKSGAGIGSDGAYSVCVDLSGNVFVTGAFESSTCTFGTYTLTNSGGGFPDIFIVKYDSNGNELWAHGTGGLSNDESKSVCTDASGNVFMAGGFSSLTMALGTTTLTNTTGGYGFNVFIAKYDANGNAIWARGAGGTTAGIGSTEANGISTDAMGNVIIIGNFVCPTITFGTYTLTNTGSSNTFVVKYDSNGNVLWAKSSIGTGTDSGNSISTDINGNAFVMGSYSSPSISFGTYTLTNSGTSNAFIVKYDSNGNELWAKSIGGDCQGYSVSTYTGGVFATGGFTSPTVIVGTNTLSAPTGSTDPMFISEYDLNGNVICSIALSSGGDDVSGVCADKFGNAYMGGDFMSNPFIVGSDTLTLAGLENIFVAKFNCSMTPVNEISINSKNIHLFPNPNNGSFKLQIDNEIKNGELILINSLGQKVHEQKIFQGQNGIIKNNLTSGLYNYIILEDKRQICNGKLAIDKN